MYTRKYTQIYKYVYNKYICMSIREKVSMIHRIRHTRYCGIACKLFLHSLYNTFNLPFFTVSLSYYLQ